ncbi:MAG: PDZ domain-containing protein [Ruminococcaceae bacterium]|nr:PDZ domain-containing protein [Oscillospiraceae bacterium]
MFTKRITPFACIVICLIVCLTSVIATRTFITVNDEPEPPSSQPTGDNPFKNFLSLANKDDAERYTKLAQLIAFIDTQGVYEFDKDAAWNEICRAYVRSIADKHAVYYTSDEYESMMSVEDGDFVGIGVHASYDYDTQGIYIFGVIPTSPAEKAGIKKGDSVIKVDGKVCNEESYYDILDAIPGEVGTDVDITVLRGEEELTFNVTRNIVPTENVLYEKLDNGIAYIKVLAFSDITVSEEFTKIINKAQSDGCSKYIFDMRGNPGGSLDEICDILDLLLPKGPIINIVNNKGATQTIHSDEKCIKGEMAVLCDGSTASAAELFTASLRDYKLATIIGTTTYGKGTMQTLQPLLDGSVVSYSTNFYNPPSNVSYDGLGIEPDIKIELDEYWQLRFFKMTHEDDTQLQKAIEVLNATK